MRKYNRLKDRYYEAFINDEDQEVFLEVPEDFPDWAPKEAYQAYIEARCDGNEEWWNAKYFDSEYEGHYESMEDFVKEYYEDEEVLRDYYDSPYDDPFFECVNLFEMGKKVYQMYKNLIDSFFEEADTDEEVYDPSVFIGDNDESYSSFRDTLSEREKVILDYIEKEAEVEGDYEGIAKGYICAISELEDTPFRYVVFDFPDSDSFINYKSGINDLFGRYGNFVYEDGFVFNVG